MKLCLWVLKLVVSLSCWLALALVLVKLRQLKSGPSLKTQSEIFACVFPFFFLPYSSTFPIKIHATDAKTQKIEPDPIFLWWTKISGAVCKPDWHNVRSCLFFYMQKFRIQCAMTFRPIKRLKVWIYDILNNVLIGSPYRSEQKVYFNTYTMSAYYVNIWN